MIGLMSFVSIVNIIRSSDVLDKGILTNHELTSPAVSFIVGITIGLISICYWIKRRKDKLEEDKNID